MMDLSFFTQVFLGLPYWAWVGFALIFVAWFAFGSNKKK